MTAASWLNHVDIYRWNGQDLVLAKRVPAVKNPSHMWIDSKRATAYVSMQNSNEVVAIDLATQNVR